MGKGQNLARETAQMSLKRLTVLRFNPYFQLPEAEKRWEKSFSLDLDCMMKWE
jgi:hypothetical protein